MKYLKIKLGVFSLLAVLAVSVFLTSCEQDLNHTLSDIDKQLEEMYADPVFTEVGIAKNSVIDALSEEGLSYESLSDEENLPEHILQLKLETNDKFTAYIDKYAELLKLDFSVLERISTRQNSLRPASDQIDNRCSSGYNNCLWDCLNDAENSYARSRCAPDCLWLYCSSSYF